MASPVRAMVVTLVAVWFGVVRPVASGDMDTFLHESEQLCEFQTPSETVGCLLQPSGPCQVFSLPNRNCYQPPNECWGDKLFKRKEDYYDEYNEEDGVTTLYIWNSGETKLYFTTVLDLDTYSWLVDLPGGEYNVTITDLPGHFNESDPIKPVGFCHNCPPPRFKWLTFRTLHKIQIAVYPKDTNSSGNVDVYLYSTNETLQGEDDCRDPNIASDFADITKGGMNETLTADEIYSTNFCFVFFVNFTMDPTKINRYACFKKENMTDPLTELPQTRIDIPIWWIVGLTVVIIFLVVASLIPCAIRKGLLRAPCMRSDSRHRRCKGNSNGYIRPADASFIFTANNTSASTYLMLPGEEANASVQNRMNGDADPTRSADVRAIRRLEETSRE